MVAFCVKIFFFRIVFLSIIILIIHFSWTKSLHELIFIFNFFFSREKKKKKTKKISLFIEKKKKR